MLRARGAGLGWVGLRVRPAGFVSFRAGNRSSAGGGQTSRGPAATGEYFSCRFCVDRGAEHLLHGTGTCGEGLRGGHGARGQQGEEPHSCVFDFFFANPIYSSACTHVSYLQSIFF
jgi:hypothetical protein